MNKKTSVQLPRDKIADFCKRNRIRKLSLFGSALKGELRKDSDIDLLVEFHPDEAPSLFDLARMERELSTLLEGRCSICALPTSLAAISATKYSPQQVSSMRKDDRVRLQHMLDVANEALTFIQGRIRADLDTDRMLVLSLVRELEIIGEAASKVSADTRSPFSKHLDSV